MMIDKWAVWRDFIFASSMILADAEAELQTEHGLNLSEFDVLVTLDAAGPEGATLGELAQNVLVTTSGVSRAVSRLIERGWVSKTQNVQDRRCYDLQLTRAGKEAVKQIAPAHRVLVREKFFDQLAPADMRAIAEPLRHLAANVRESR